MNGIELFDSAGVPILVKDVKTSKPSLSSNNLINGMNLKGAAEDMFTTPVSKDGPFEVTLNFGKTFKLSMVRIWNYWVDKQSWKKGVRVMSMYLDNKLIFAGYVAHCTEGKAVQNRHDFILFTQDQNIVQEISEHDWLKDLIEKEEAEIDDLALKDLKTGLGVQLVSATSTRFRLERNSSRKSKVKYSDLSK
jgi:hypothetical protein